MGIPSVLSCITHPNCFHFAHSLPHAAACGARLDMVRAHKPFSTSVGDAAEILPSPFCVSGM